MTREKAHSAPFFALNTLRYLEYATTRVKVWVPITLGVSTSSYRFYTVTVVAAVAAVAAVVAIVIVTLVMIAPRC